MAEATIRDVARRAQVSVASVSRALNNLANVSERTRARVNDAVRELGYIPHAGARSLSLARTNAIGVVLPDLHGEFFSEIVRGMDKEANSRGYLLLLSNMHAGSAHAGNALKALRGRVDGMIVMAPHLSEADLAAALPTSTPAIFVNTPSTVRAGIRLDNAAGAAAVAKHFVELGRKQIVHIAGPPGNIDADERAEAFRKALNQSGAQLEVVNGDFSEDSGQESMRLLLDSGASFDAVFAANDMMASGALQALREAGIAVPEDVAVCGFDDIPLARHIGLTTVRVRIAELGQRAIRRLLDLIEVDRHPHGQELHSPELIVRTTSLPK